MVGEGVDDPLDDGPGVGEGDVGEGDGEEGDGEEVGVGLDVGVGVLVTGGATPGGTLFPAVRSCCQDQPTEPPAGTVSEPTPYEE